MNIPDDLKKVYDSTDPAGFSIQSYPASHTRQLIERIGRVEAESSGLVADKSDYYVRLEKCREEYTRKTKELYHRIGELSILKDKLEAENTALKEDVKRLRIFHRYAEDGKALLAAALQEAEHRHQIAALNSQVERLSAPVSTKEIADNFHLDDWGVQCVYRNGFDGIVAARKEAANGSNG